MIPSNCPKQTLANARAKGSGDRSEEGSCYASRPDQDPLLGRDGLRLPSRLLALSTLSTAALMGHRVP